MADDKLEEIDQFMLLKLQKVIDKSLNAYENYDFSTVYQTIHNFCSIELSSFYLDFAKDILYIEAEDHPRRRSIQTVYYEIVTSLVKLLTPILTHTMEEVWSFIPDVQEEYVQLCEMPKTRDLSNAARLEKKNGIAL